MELGWKKKKKLFLIHVQYYILNEFGLPSDNNNNSFFFPEGTSLAIEMKLNEFKMNNLNELYELFQLIEQNTDLVHCADQIFLFNHKHQVLPFTRVSS